MSKGKNLKKSVYSGKGLTILHQNINSLKHKVTDLELCLSDFNDVSVLCLTEHWCRLEELESIRIKDFKLISSYCRIKAKGGGTCIFTKTIFNFKARVDIEKQSKEGELEITAIEGETTSPFQNIIILALYRPPQGNVKNFLLRLEQIMSALLKRHTKILLCGDFNINLNSNTSSAHQFLNLLNSFNLKPQISSATRVAKTSSTLIDNIFTNITDKIEAYNIHLSLSDHYGQLLKIKSLGIHQNIQAKYMYKRHLGIYTV